jgi:hypothetical protein
VPKRLAIFGVSLSALLAVVVIVLPRIRRAPSAAAGIADPNAITAYNQALPVPPPGTKPVATSPSANHSITVKFDYDFGRTPACSAKITKKCVKQFNVYDISGGSQNRVKLFSIPLPDGASGQIKGITGTSPQLSLELGTHFLAVASQWPDGTESETIACYTTVQIKP